MKNIVIQLICPDQKGIIAQLTSILYKTNNNILSIEQHVDKETKKLREQEFDLINLLHEIVSRSEDILQFILKFKK